MSDWYGTSVSFASVLSSSSMDAGTRKEMVVVDGLSSGKVARTALLQSLRPLLRAVQDAYDVNDLVGDLVDHDIRKRRKYEFARPLFLARTSTVRERQQRGGRVVNSAHQFRCSLRRVLK